MVPTQSLNTYRQLGKQGSVHPVKLVHMMFGRVLCHLGEVKIGIRENDPKLRGENLSKAIALISELHASVDPKDESEAATFLRGLYVSILVELPKVAINGDMAIIERTEDYMKRLKDMWEDTAMQEHGFVGREESVNNNAVAGNLDSASESDTDYARLSVST